MSSLPTRENRRFLRASGLIEPKPQPVRIHEDAYEVLHPTKGWRRVNYRRAYGRTFIKVPRS